MNETKPKRKSYLIVGTVVLVIAGLGGAYCALTIPAKKRRAESIRCAFWLRMNVGLVAQLYAQDNGQRMPTNYENLASGRPVPLNQPRFWVCPSDKSNPMAGQRDWSRFRAEQASYEIVSPGVADTETNAVFLRCRIHGHVLFVDGSVYDGVKKRWPRDN